MVNVPPRCGSVASARSRLSVCQGSDILPREGSIYKGMTSQSPSWKPRKSVPATVGQAARDAGLKKFNGASRRSAEWDGLRRDPELWFPDGDCLVHLYGRGQSRRGAAFNVPYSALLRAQCQPLLNRFLHYSISGSPASDSSSNDDNNGYFDHSKTSRYELYIPAPPSVGRSQAMLYHIATRNLFAWVFGRSLVGAQLGSALVGLLHSMNEFRSPGCDNVQDLLDFMDEEGYADLRSTPSHALSVLYFAEHFHFKDLYIDAFAHCVGMNHILDDCSEFEFTSKVSRTLIRRGRTEMDARLSRYGRSLSNFLEDELSSAQLPLSSGARFHLDRFRAFLQAYYVAKLGYYPPTSPDGHGHAFPKEVLETMCTDFQMLFDFLVDEDWMMADHKPEPVQGIQLLRHISAFDEKHHFATSENPLPLVPGAEANTPVRSRSRLSFLSKSDKLKLDPRLAALSAMNKATNKQRTELLESSLVRAYKGFEKDCIFSTARTDRSQQTSAADARKVRWVLIYCMLQTLRSTTAVPEQVRDTQNIRYNISVSTTGCPPFKGDKPYDRLMKTQSQYAHDGLDWKSGPLTTPSTPTPESSNRDSFSLRRDLVERTQSAQSFTFSDNMLSKGNVRRALSSLGNMPELVHPRPQRNSFHEILVSGYGNGVSTVTCTASPLATPALVIKTSQLPEHIRGASIDSGVSDSALSSTWSHSSDSGDSSASSISDFGHGRSDSTISLGKHSILDILAQPIQSLAGQTPQYSQDINTIRSDEHLKPQPLSVRKSMLPEANVMMVTKEVHVHYENVDDLEKHNPELEAYLSS